ncbi:response regulator transcription factor [Thioclava sp.]|uniref:response regulator transcription factor n=1 Tax=Thioclava sp. TaxID=1933450 RepID=UPI003242DC88
MMRALILEDLAEARTWLHDIAQASFPGPLQIDLAATCQAGLSAAGQNDYDLALIDLKLPDGSGIDVLRALRTRSTRGLYVVTTVLGGDENIVAALSAGADGYILKEQPAELVILQLSQLSQGIPALSPPVARRIIEHFRRTGPAVGDEEVLTARESDVLALLGRGMRNSDVSALLGLSGNTVATHIKSIYKKLGISSRAEAAWHATMLGLTSGVPGES